MNGLKSETPWWKTAVIYQVYPRSFQDTNGDGIGDIPGIISRLDYLALLGIDAIWLSPVFSSPQDDNGYDIADYQGIDPIFGTMEDMDRLIEEAGKRNIRIILDLVLNHSSDEHRWFLAARSGREDPCHEFYIWRDGEEGTPPNDMTASFGGSAWEWVPELRQYYFHQYSRKQPDLNWENPALRRTLYDMINWWTDKGVGGFRLDVVDHLGKDPDRRIKTNGPRLHEFIREMSRACFQRNDLVTVGEAWSATTDTGKLYSAPDGSELSMVFQFQHILLDQQEGKEKWDLAPLPLCRLKEVFQLWERELEGRGWNSFFWENHDLPRIVSRWGNDSGYRVVCAKMFAILLHGMQGTPYIYQGEELGMTNAPLALEEYRDIESLNMIRERRERGASDEEILRALHRKSRDNARTPMQWTAEKNAGFTSGTPWLKVNPNYTEINAASQIVDEDSVFHCYRRLIQFRKQYPVFTDGTFRLLFPDSDDLFAYTRTNRDTRLTVLCNFREKTVPDLLPEEDRGELLIENYPESRDGTLRPYEARMYLRKL